MPAGVKAPTRRKGVFANAVRKLEVQPIPGYVMYWFNKHRVPLAIEAGYEFVTPDEVHVNQVGLATDKDKSGNQSLGNQVEVSGGNDADGKSAAMVLMKTRIENREEDQAITDGKNAQILDAIFNQQQVVQDQAQPQSAEDKRQNYIKTAKLEAPSRKK